MLPARLRLRLHVLNPIPIPTHRIAIDMDMSSPPITTPRTAIFQQHPPRPAQIQADPHPIRLGMPTMLGIVSEQLEHILHRQLGRRGLALDRRVRELAFLFLQIQDALLNGIFDGELVDDDVLCLVQPVYAVDGLFFYELGRYKQ